MAASSIKDYVAGAISGVAGLIVGHPLDTAKSGGLLRGMSVPIISYGLVNSVLFGAYGNALRLFDHGKGKQENGEKRFSLNHYFTVAMAGSIAAFAQVFVACPVDVVKVVLQSQLKPLSSKGFVSGHNTTYLRGPVDCLRLMIIHNGMLGGCYRGLDVMLVRDVVASVVYFSTYEIMNDNLQRLWGQRTVFSDVCNCLLAGGTAGVLSWSLIFPIDTVKSHLQADYLRQRYRGTGAWRQCVDDILLMAESQGYTTRTRWRIFFKGLSACALRAFPVNAVIFAVHTQALRLLDRV